jgi:NADH-quinone oxidoreductase subunit F
MIRRCDHLTRTYAVERGFTLDVYERRCEGYKAARKVLTTMTQAEVVDQAKKGNIRGRGGAGFPMGVKWSFMKPHPTKPAYLVVNADEGEPGTHKDRTIMERNPHSAIEGCIIGCYGIGAHTAYIYVRDELHLSKARLRGAIREAYAKGYLGKTPFGKDYPIDVVVHTGAGA